MSPVLRARFGAVEVEPCGALPANASPEAFEAARACVARAVAVGRPFVYEQALRGIDSNPILGLVGVREGGKLVVYYAHYDDYDCAGSCPERGHTTLLRCEQLIVQPKFDACHGSPSGCYDCRGEVKVSACVFGGKRP